MAEQLAALIEKVEGRTANSPCDEELIRLVRKVFPSDSRWSLRVCFLSALHGSLDAAVAFTEALLPDHRWTVDITGEVVVWMPEPHPTDPRQTAWEGVGHSDNPVLAIALVLAALKAYSSKGEGEWFSPARNSLSHNSIIPAAIFDSVPCSARSIARHADVESAFQKIAKSPLYYDDEIAEACETLYAYGAERKTHEQEVAQLYKRLTNLLPARVTKEGK